MSVRYHESYIRRVPLFAPLSAVQFDMLLSSFEQRRYSAGEMILVQGTIPTGLFILLSGQAVWVQAATNGIVNQLGMMQVGQHIHDEALLRDDVVDTASLQAITTTTMLILNRKTLRILLTKRPELQAALGINVARPKPAPKPAPKPKAIKAEAQTIRIGSVSPFASHFETHSGASIYRKHWSLWLQKIFFPAFFGLVGLGGMLGAFFGNPDSELAATAWGVSGLLLLVGIVWFFFCGIAGFGGKFCSSEISPVFGRGCPKGEGRRSGYW